MLAVVAAGCLDREAPDGCDGGKSTKTEVNDGAWYERKCGEDEALYRAEDKSPLHIFLGTEFGTYQHVRGDRFVRVREGFGPFGWVRSLGHQQYRVEGVQAYHLFNGSDGLVSRADGLVALFSNVYNVVFSPTNAADLVYGMTGKSCCYDISVLVRGPIDATNVCAGAKAYELLFSVVNPKIRHDRKFDELAWSIESWQRAFPPIVVRPEVASDPEAWRYHPPAEPTTEEQLMHAIKMKDPKLVPRFAGMPGVMTLSKNVQRFYSGCTEGEADEFNVDNRFFYRWCSEAEKDRMAELSTRPQRMRPRGSGEKRIHRPGYFDGEILSGDTVRWFDDNKDWRTGTVVGKDEGGEYVKDFKCYVKTTHVELMAKESDWLPSPMTTNYQARARAVHALMKQLKNEVDAFYESRGSTPGLTVTNRLDLIRKFMDALREQNKPGYHPVITYSVLQMPTKAAARATVARNEIQAKNRWLSEVNRAIEDIISHYFSWDVCRHNGRKHRVCDNCRKMITERCALSPYEVYQMVYGWPMDGFPEPRVEIISPYRPLGAPVPPNDPYFHCSIATEASAETVLRALRDKPITNDVEFALSAWTAIGTAIESPAQFDKFRLMQRLADVTVQHGTAKACAWLSGRMIIEYGETSYLPWEFAYCVSDAIAKSGVKNDLQYFAPTKSEGGSQGHMEKSSERIIKWTKERFASNLFKELKAQKVDPRGMAVWERRFPPASAVRP